ncbi:hypothetical protein GCM10009715_10440 [Paeniglutamicibacter psychrophenolicus]
MRPGAIRSLPSRWVSIWGTPRHADKSARHILQSPRDFGEILQRWPVPNGFGSRKSVRGAQRVREPQECALLDFGDGDVDNPEFVEFKCLELVQILGE